LSTLLGATSRAGDLTYKFKADDTPIYNVKITAEVGDKVETYSGLIELKIQEAGGRSGQVTLGYSSSVQKRQAHNNNPFDGTLGNGMATSQVVIGKNGEVVSATDIPEDNYLPFILGVPFTLVVQPLPGDVSKTSWDVQENLSTFTVEKEPARQNWGPPHMRQQRETKIVKPAKTTINFSIEKRDGNMVTIKRKVDLVSLEVLDDNTPTLRNYGEGEFVFDTDAGLVRTLDMKQTIVVNNKNSSFRLPFTVHAELMAHEQVAKLKAERDEAMKKSMASLEEARARHESEKKYDVDKLPEGVTKTPKNGGNGGSEYMKLGEKGQPVIGFTYVMSDWGGVPCLRRLDPVFDRSAVKEGQPNTVLAKPGYAVSGLKCRHFEMWGVQVQFAKLKPNGSLDMKDTYNAEWINDRGEGEYKQLAGDGNLVVGTWGRQGLNLDAIGLLTKASKE
jgi:hypothetical protein